MAQLTELSPPTSLTTETWMELLAAVQAIDSTQCNELANGSSPSASLQQTEAKQYTKLKYKVIEQVSQEELIQELSKKKKQLFGPLYMVVPIETTKFICT